jgi:hypothetical protein
MCYRLPTCCQVITIANKENQGQEAINQLCSLSLVVTLDEYLKILKKMAPEEVVDEI